MFLTIWHTFFFDPVYNGLIFFIDTVPGGDIGVAVVLTTVVVKFLLFPLSIKAARTQKVMREIDPKLKEIKEKHKDDRQEQAQAMMAIYKEAGLNPFASVLLLFIQIPLIIALYYAVYRGGGVPLPDVNTALLYPFVPVPETVSMLFLGMIDIASKSLPLALGAGLTQYIYGHLAFPKPEPRTDEKPDLKADFARSMQMQMRYMMPVIIFFVAYTLSGVVALYFIVSNLMQIAQEFLVRKHK